MENNIDNFLKSCDELINCKFLVAEYKLQKMLQELANTQEICTLIGECLEAFNRDREFSKSFVQDGNGEFMFLLPDEEYKILALVFCTLMDIDAKKIDFTDFVKRFFGNSENPYQEFVKEMILPFKKLIEEAFGYSSPKEENSDNNIEEITVKDIESNTTHIEYEYELLQYTKDEYIKLMSEQNYETQLALVELYESLGV